LSNPEEANINQLAAQIASGKLDLEDKKLQKALIEITKKKISVDNPKYSTYKKLIK